MHSHSNNQALLPGTPIVVLGGGIEKDGMASLDTRQRAMEAVDLAMDLPNSTIIFSGNGRKNNEPLHQDSEALLMMRIFMKEVENKVRNRPALREALGALWKQNLEARIALECQSMDTMGNAVLVAARYFVGETPRPVQVVTSMFHHERAELAFKGVLGSDWCVSTHPTKPTADDDKRGAQEAGGVVWTQEFLANISPGNVTSAVLNLLEKKPAYQQFQWLTSFQNRAERGEQVLLGV